MLIKKFKSLNIFLLLLITLVGVGYPYATIAYAQTAPTVKIVTTINPPSQYVPPRLIHGYSFTVTWVLTNTTSCTGTGDLAGVNISAGGGHDFITPTLGLHTYGITCTGPGGTASDTNSVEIISPLAPLPTFTISANPSSVTEGGSTTITWSAQGASSCLPLAEHPNWNTSTTSGTEIVGPLHTPEFRFSITCLNSFGEGRLGQLVVPVVIQKPTISNISPVSPLAGGKVTVIGSNFIVLDPSILVTSVILDEGVYGKTKTINPILVSPTSFSFSLPSTYQADNFPGINVSLSSGTHTLTLKNISDQDACNGLGSGTCTILSSNPFSFVVGGASGGTGGSGTPPPAECLGGPTAWGCNPPPVTPSNPSNPANPSNPSNPTNPVNPSNPTNTPSDQSTGSYNFGNTTLYRGVKGDGVKELQRFFNENFNLSLVLDGKFGPKTTAIVKQWQSEHGLKMDGRVGPKTKAMMSAEIR